MYICIKWLQRHEVATENLKGWWSQKEFGEEKPPMVGWKTKRPTRQISKQPCTITMKYKYKFTEHSAPKDAGESLLTSAEIYNKPLTASSNGHRHRTRCTLSITSSSCERLVGRLPRMRSPLHTPYTGTWSPPRRRNCPRKWVTCRESSLGQCQAPAKPSKHRSQGQLHPVTTTTSWKLKEILPGGIAHDRAHSIPP